MELPVPFHPSWRRILSCDLLLEELLHIKREIVKRLGLTWTKSIQEIIFRFRRYGFWRILWNLVTNVSAYQSVRRGLHLPVFEQRIQEWQWKIIYLVWQIVTPRSDTTVDEIPVYC